MKQALKKDLVRAPKAAKAGKRVQRKTRSEPRELDLLFPDITLSVRDPDRGRSVSLTVHEFRFREGLEAQALARPLIERFSELAQSGKPISVSAVEAEMGSCAEIWLGLIAKACGREREWLARLSDEDARGVSSAMWQANAVFFVRRIIANLTESAAVANLFRSIASSPNSSEPGLEADTKRSRSV